MIQKARDNRVKHVSDNNDMPIVGSIGDLVWPNDVSGDGRIKGLVQLLSENISKLVGSSALSKPVNDESCETVETTWTWS